MSGLVGGVANGFEASLQQAYFRGVPFSVVAQAVRQGRKNAMHDYPFRDGGWVEDMGRALAVYRFSGYLVGDLAPVMELALKAAINTPGPGLLIHPTLGAVHVAMLSSSTSVHKNKRRVIEIAFEFIEAGAALFPSIVTATIGKALAAVADALPALVSDLAAIAVFTAGIGVAMGEESGHVTGAYAAQCEAAAGDPAALAGMVANLPPPDAGSSYGRYAAGSAVASLPAGTTVPDLQAQLAESRAATSAAAAGLATAAADFSGATAAEMVNAIAATTEAARAVMLSPADQVRLMLRLAVFGYSDANGGAGLSGLVAQLRDAVSAACRRAALLSLVRAAAAYQPRSYDDAATLRETVAAALDAEITAAGDAGQDSTYQALRQVRAAMVADLTARGAALPLVETVRTAMPLPALVVAWRQYQDATRDADVLARSGAVHPAFLPVEMRLLAA